MKQLIATYLNRIANILLINVGFLDNPGLYTGEMGLVVFFLRYARHTQNKLFSDCGFELMQIVHERIHVKMPIGYKQGVTGIGSAIEHLVQEGYIEADTDELLCDFDNRINSIHNLLQLSFEEILGMAYYIIWRMSGRSSKKDFFLNTQLPSIIAAIQQRLLIHGLKHPAISALQDMIETEKTINIHDLPKIPEWNQVFSRDKPQVSKSDAREHILELVSKNDYFDHNNLNFGIENGLVGLGITLLTEIDNDHSWISLFPNELTPLPDESLPV